MADSPVTVPAVARTRAWMTLDQAAERLGVAQSTLREWDNAGVFSETWRTPGGHRRFARAEVERMVTSRTQAETDVSIVGLIELAVGAVRAGQTDPGQAVRLADDLDRLGERLRLLAAELREAGRDGS